MLLFEFDVERDTDQHAVQGRHYCELDAYGTVNDDMQWLHIE